MAEKSRVVSKESLEKRKSELFFETGRSQFHKQILEARLIEMNQEINSINQHLDGIRRAEAAKAGEASKPAPDPLVDPEALPPPPAPEEMPAPEGI